jgi:soluble lytic murein transglycosylase-like protein
MNNFLKKGAAGALLVPLFLAGWLYEAAVPKPLASLATPSGTELAALQEAAARLREKAALAGHLAAKYRQPQVQVLEIVVTAYKEAAKHKLSPLLVLAIVEKESSLRVKVSNTYGAMGLMQVVPRFHAEKLLDPENTDELLTTSGNIRVGTQIVAEYLRHKKGNLEKALVKYSGNARDYYPKVIQFKYELQAVIDSNSGHPK